MGKNNKPTSLFKIHIAARVLIQNEHSRYLLLKRKMSQTYGGTWELPGGKLESLETIVESTTREVFEETSFVVNVDKKASHISTYIAKEGKYLGDTFLNLIYSGNIIAGKIKLVDHDKYGWFTKEEIIDMNISHYLKMPLIELLFPH